MIRDILSNFRVFGPENQTDSNPFLDVPDAVTRPTNQASGATTFYEVIIPDKDPDAVSITDVIESMEIRFTDETDISNFNNLPVNIANDSVGGALELGNKITNLLTGEDAVFPHDLAADGPLYLGVEVCNPAGTFENVFLHFNMTLNSNSTIYSIVNYAGPVRFGEDATIGA